MKTKLLNLVMVIFFCAKISAQDFVGYVKKADSTSSPIFQARVEILEGDKAFNTLKTYFDGSFKFTPNKNQNYTIKISYTGYTDTSYTIKTDKNAKTSEQNITVKLKKDGMRLMGIIKSREEDFPIKGATIVLKNVMTRKENRITTDIDGRYNFKLEYETNYRVSIDKRSPGMINKFKDTTFYISTTGFNQPLDYKLDIALDEMPYPTTAVREGYDATKQSANDKLKPVVDISVNKNKYALDTISQLRTELEKTKKKLEEIQKEKEVGSNKASLDTSFVSQNLKEEKNTVLKNANIKIIGDSLLAASNNKAKNIVPDELEIARLKGLAEKNARETEEKIAAKKKEEKEKADIVAGDRKMNDSIVKIRQKNEWMIKAAAQLQKAKQDSVSKAKVAQEKKVKEAVAKKQTKDSLANIQAIAARKKFIKDSIDFVKELAEKRKAEENIMKKRIAEEETIRKAKEDSITGAIREKKQKAIQDSIAYIKLLADQKRKSEFVIRQKIKEDSIARMKARQDSLFVKQKTQVDSASRLKELAVKIPDKNIEPKSTYLTKTQEELIKAAEVFAKRKKFVQDSIASVNEQLKKKAQGVAAPQKLANDSLERKKNDKKK